MPIRVSEPSRATPVNGASNVIVEPTVRIDPDVAETFFVPAILFCSPAV